jgi:hypothetical protein
LRVLIVERISLWDDFWRDGLEVLI